MFAYYNEHDPRLADWLVQLIKGGHLPEGEVDERDIQDVCATDLTEFTQCHFFAGIGGWPYALQLAGWPRERAVWTGSCPCQPFSAAGAQSGVADPRHLWPAWFRLIRESRPAVCFGEQVAAAIRHGWWDLVQGDLEGEGYACGMAVLGAHSVGAFHLRQRLWFVADAESGDGRLPIQQRGSQQARVEPIRRSEVGDVGDTDDTRSQGRRERGHSPDECAPRSAGVAGGMGDTEGGRQREFRDAMEPRCGGHVDGTVVAHFWSDVEWIACRDGKHRPTQPGLFPLAHGVPARVGRLRGYGNAIVPQVAVEFIRAYLAGAA